MFVVDLIYKHWPLPPEKECFRQKSKALNSAGTFTMEGNKHRRILADYSSVLEPIL